MAIDTYPPLDVLAQPSAVGCHVRQTASTSIPNITHTAMSFNTVHYDTDGMFALSSPGRITVRTPGKYLVWATAAFTSGAGAYRHINMFHNRGGVETEIVLESKAPAGGGNFTGLVGVAVIDCLAGDYFWTRVYQDSGGALSLVGGTTTPAYGHQMGASLMSGNANGVPSGARVYRTTNFSVPNAAYTPIAWTTAESDTDAIWDGSTRLYARKAGWYVVSGSAFFTTNATGSHRIFRIVKNGSDPLGEAMSPFSGTAGPRANPSAVVFLSAGDYVTLEAYQDSGAALNVVAGTGESCELGMVCITGTTVSTREMPAAEVRLNAAQSIASTTGVRIPWGKAIKDNDGMWNSGAPTRLTIRTPGRYLVVGHMEFTGSTGIRQLGIWKNGQYVTVTSTQARTDNFTHLEATDILDLMPGDFIELEVYHTQGAAAQVGGTGEYTSDLIVQMLAPVSVAALNTPEALRVVGAAGQPAFQNSWSQYGGYAPVGFWKDPFGVVHLQGMIQGGVIGTNTPMFTLPLGYRPVLSTHLFDTQSNAGVGRVDVFTDGKVSAMLGSNAWFTLDGISFRAA